MWKCKASRWSPVWRSYSPFVRWNEISSGLIFSKVLIVTLKFSSSMLGLMGLYVWLWCWVRADPGDPEQGKCCRYPDRAKRRMGRDSLKKQADHIFVRAWVQRHWNWFQKGNGLNKHQCCTGSQIWGRIVTICLKPHAFKAAISICPYPRTDVIVQMEPADNGAFVCISFLHFHFCSGSQILLGCEELLITHSLQSHHRWDEHDELYI